MAQYDAASIAKAINKTTTSNQKYSRIGDKGPCNLDSVVIFCPGLRKSTFEAIEKLTPNVSLYLQEERGRRIYLDVEMGQGQRRTKIVEAACENLRKSGLKAYVVYRQD